MRFKHAPRPSSDAAAIDTAWRIHQAQVEWTGKVDAKATFAFAIESAALATVVALTTNGRLFSDLEKYWLILYWVGLISLLISASFAALVVIPRLRSKHLAKESQTNFIYFGHARLWDVKELESALKDTAVLPQLSLQIVRMADISWTKHVRVQWSFCLAALGGIALVVCGFGSPT